MNAAKNPSIGLLWWHFHTIVRYWHWHRHLSCNSCVVVVVIFVIIMIIMISIIITAAAAQSQHNSLYLPLMRAARILLSNTIQYTNLATLLSSLSLVASIISLLWSAPRVLSLAPYPLQPLFCHFSFIFWSCHQKLRHIYSKFCSIFVFFSVIMLKLMVHSENREKKPKNKIGIASSSFSFFLFSHITFFSLSLSLSLVFSLFPILVLVKSFFPYIFVFSDCQTLSNSFLSAFDVYTHTNTQEHTFQKRRIHKSDVRARYSSKCYSWSNFSLCSLLLLLLFGGAGDATIDVAGIGVWWWCERRCSLSNHRTLLLRAEDSAHKHVYVNCIQTTVLYEQNFEYQKLQAKKAMKAECNICMNTHI